MNEVFLVWLKFERRAVLILFAGNRLLRHCGVIADKTGMSGRCVFNLAILVVLHFLFFKIRYLYG